MAAPGYVLKNWRTTLERAEKFISPIYFTDCNLLGRLYPQKAELKSLKHYAAPGRVTFDEAVAATFTDTSVGKAFGPTWATHWFLLEIEIPESWEGQQVNLRWNSESEALVWKDGVPLQGLTNENRRTDFPLTKCHKTSEKHQSLYIEMACNGLFGAGDGSEIAPTKLDRYFPLKQADIAVKDTLVYKLILDIEVLIGMAKHLGSSSNRAHQALYTVNEIVNMCTPEDRAAYVRARELAEKFFAETNGSSQHVICAVGNCHIDSAWLWPYAETIRKCARSFSSTIRLMEQYPEFSFACSQGQQFEWVKTHYPVLYKEIKQFVSEGRFLPVGGVWCEMDGNIPSGEAFARQFLYGQKFFEAEFGLRCKEFWLPDTFGYSAQLPQIMQLSGIERFVTQKMSWNLVNKFPHHTFWWEGLDGSRVLTHFPPGDCYLMEGWVDEVLKNVNNFQDKGRSNHSLYLYGYGDGGQGPTQDMIERLQRMKDIDGLPKVQLSSPDEFFHQVETHESHNLCHWQGELYLELHNGTYTTQAKTKQKNRQCEFLLQDIEAVSALALLHAKSKGFSYPSQELLRLWKLLLLNQFHDVLPGTSIADVYKDAMNFYKDINNSGNKLLQTASNALFSFEGPETEKASVVVNTQSWRRQEVIAFPADSGALSSPVKKKQRTEPITQDDTLGNTLVLVDVPSFGYSQLSPADTLVKPAVAEKGKDDMIYMSNEHLEAVLDPLGRLVGVFVAGCSKNGISAEKLGNQFVLFDDIPLYWDAWDVMDYHLETRHAIEEPIQHAMITEEGPLRATVEVTLKISDTSYIKQYIILEAAAHCLKFKTEVAWHEKHKFLKVEFPLNVHSNQATYEIQYGHLRRPTHMNTSWDWARFEVCGHKWADMSEYNWGVAVLNDCKYGWSALGSVLRLSLLRSSKSPDPKADMGTHTFTYAVMPHQGTFQDAGVIEAAYNLNNPLRLSPAQLPADCSAEHSYAKLSTPSVVLETFKKAEERDDAFVLRFYESYGGQVSAAVKLALPVPVRGVKLCNILEDILDSSDEKTPCLKDDVLHLDFKPFQVISVMLLV